MSSIPKKGDIIINPQTQRPVKVGSRTWLKLVRDKVVEGSYKDPNEIYALQEGDDEAELINQFNRKLPPSQQAVRGRGKYQNKIVRRHKQPSTQETSRYTVKKTATKIKNREVYEDLQEGGNFEEDLEALIMGELANLDDVEEDYEEFDEEEYAVANLTDIDEDEEEEEEEDLGEDEGDFIYE